MSIYISVSLVFKDAQNEIVAIMWLNKTFNYFIEVITEQGKVVL